MRNQTPIARLTAVPAVAEQLTKVKAALAQYEAVLLNSEDERHPAQAIARMREQLNTITDPADAKAILDRVAVLSSPAAPEVASIHTRIAMQQFEPARVELLKLLSVAGSALAGMITEATEGEADFFSGWGVAPHRTEVSGRYARLANELAEYAKAWSTPPSALPTVANLAALHAFGVSDITV